MPRLEAQAAAAPFAVRPEKPSPVTSLSKGSGPVPVPTMLMSDVLPGSGTTIRREARNGQAMNNASIRRISSRSSGSATPFPGEVRRILYTTNAIEALNAKLRRAVRARGHFPNDEAAMKLLFLVLNHAQKDWKMGPREWCLARAQFAVLFGERFTRAAA